MVISQALLKYGYACFSLEILEYCDTEVLITREQYYFDSLHLYYNIKKIAGSSLGYKHTEETIKKIRNSKKGRSHSSKTKQKMKDAWTEGRRKLKSEAMKGITISDLTKQKMKDSWTAERRLAKYEARSKSKASEATKQKLKDLWTEELRKAQSKARGKSIFVYSLQIELLFTFPSSRAAAKHFNCDDSQIMRYARSRYIFKKEYILSLEILESDFQPTFKIRRSTTIFLFSLQQELLNSFPSVNAAAEHFYCSISSIWRYARSGAVFKDKFILSLEKSSPNQSMESD
jgi:group I intron endonuclease